MPNESSEIGSGFVKIFYGILLTLAICAGIYAIATPLVSEGGFFDNSLNSVLDGIMLDINESLDGEVTDSPVMPPAGENDGN